MIVARIECFTCLKRFKYFSQMKTLLKARADLNAAARTRTWINMHLKMFSPTNCCPECSIPSCPSIVTTSRLIDCPVITHVYTGARINNPAAARTLFCHIKPTKTLAQKSRRKNNWPIITPFWFNRVKKLTVDGNITIKVLSRIKQSAHY